MIKNWLITGDIHGNLERFTTLPYDTSKRAETAIILLGDAGFNYYGRHKSGKVYPNNKDLKMKEDAEVLGYTFYCVRGNHEFRPEHLPNIILEYDENVQGEVYYEPKYPHIKYFKNWGKYQIGEWKTAVIGGAYSVDKFYRLGRHWQWFDDEQLSPQEQTDCKTELAYDSYDLILTHTCPISWQPTDLFIPTLDQSTVDSSTEKFLEDMRSYLDFNIWLFGHYHQDRYVRPGVEMLFTEIRDLNQLMRDWYNPKWEIPKGKIIDYNFHK